jgi:predicted MPP superfamily phosphohydrolase
MFMVFFSVVITIYGLINAHIFLRAWEVIPADASWRLAFVLLFWLLAASFVAGRMLERVAPAWLSTPVVWIGSFWLALMAYLYCSVLALDIIRFVDHLVPFLPSILRADPATTRRITAEIVLGAALLAVVIGHLNARSPRIRTIELTIAKRSAVPAMTVVVASDIHLGTLVCRKFFDRIVGQINTADADLVLLAGDIVDEDVEPVVRQDLGESIRRIRSRLGVYGITGNHEYIGGAEPACAYLQTHGIRMLRDATAAIDDAVVLVGREDLSAKRFGGKGRKPLAELMENVDRSLPIILMDHQPMHLQEAVDNGVDLQVSGHTHHGQLWPFQYITKKVYEVSWGYKRKENTHVYVSCGVGTWGPPVRTNNRPEIVVFKLRFAPPAAS